MSSTLIVVDLQKGFVTNASRHVLKPIERIQHKYDRVIFTRFTNPDPSPFRRILGYYKMTPGDEETEFAIEPRKGAIIIQRPLYTCVNAALKRHLFRHKVKEVHLCGIATEACVFKTALDLFEQDIRSILLSNLCASDQKAHYHNIGIELFKKLLGKHNVLSSRTALKYLPKL